MPAPPPPSPHDASTIPVKRLKDWRPDDDLRRAIAQAQGNAPKPPPLHPR